MATIAKSYNHRGGTEPLLGHTIPDHFNGVANRFGQQEAIVSVPQNRRLNYTQLAAAVDTLALGLLGLGFRPGDRIGIWSTNNIEWILLQMATARMGIILVNINPAYRGQELAYAIERAEIHGIFAIPRFRTHDYIATLAELIPELSVQSNRALTSNTFPALRRVVVFDPSNPVETLKDLPGTTLWAEVLDAGATVPPEELEAITASLDIDDPINIQYTSGTTGYPKAVVLSHHNLLNNAVFTARTMHFTHQDRLCIPVPFYHCFGMVVANLLCFSVGACAVIPCEHFDPDAVLHAVETERCTAIHGVPTMFIAALEHPQFARFDLSSLRTGIMAGAPCPPALMKRVMEEMHCREILIGYGETEASPLTHLTACDDNLERRTETVGKNLPHQEVKVADPTTGQTLPMGTVGEICFRGYHIMHGYYGDAEATREAIDAHGWLRSGDLGSMDAEGYLTITGRLKEMIIRGGENIYPREIEDLIFTHPKVADVAVIGVPDAFYGEEVMAWVQPHEGERLTDGEIRNYCKDKLAHFKIPKYIWFVTEFPMTVTGKIKKFRMREIAVERLKE